MLRLLCIVIAALVLTPATALAQARTLEPSGDWEFRAEDEYCRISRSFGSGSRQVSMYFYSYGPTGSYQVVLVGERLPRNTSKARTARLAWGDSEEPQPTMVINGALGDNGTLTFRTLGNRPAMPMTWYWSGDSDHRIGVPFDAAAQQLVFSTSEMEETALQLGDMSAPLHQLADCELALLEDWGFDPGEFTTLASQPELENGYEVLRYMSWPTTLLLNRHSLFLHFRMTVDLEGQAQDCVLQAPAMDSREGRLLCRDFVRMARFTPATNAQGEPVEAMFRSTSLVFVFD